jgi:hypothetical protein
MTFRAEDGSGMFLRNADIYLQVYGVTTQKTNIYNFTAVRT